MSLQPRPRYCRETGFFEPEYALPFKALRAYGLDKFEVAGIELEASNQLFEILADWEVILKAQ
ncbi:MAG: hypothetical protein AAF723_10755, partial [Pseudomonadota bacterium]